MSTMKQLTIELAIVVAVAAAGFFAGYECALNRAFASGQREVAAYVEDCTIERAHAAQCVIPCSSESDCLTKNGSRDAY